VAPVPAEGRDDPAPIPVEGRFAPEAPAPVEGRFAPEAPMPVDGRVEAPGRLAPPEAGPLDTEGLELALLAVDPFP
jgi:hypothetical protein